MQQNVEMEIGQERFLQAGGVFELAIAHKKARGELPKQYVFAEYPKMLRFNERAETNDESTENCKGHIVTKPVTRLLYDEVIVHSEEEEERVLSGGKTSRQIEEERQTLINRCRAQHIQVDPTWSTIRLRRELRDEMDTPQPADRMASLEQELAGLKKMADMQAEIDALRARLSGTPATPEIAQMRDELEQMGVKVDLRWSARTLQEKLDEALRA